MSTTNIIEKSSDADDTNRMNKNDPNTKTEYSKADSQQCNVEKEVIESENGKIERTTISEQQIGTQTKRQTVVTETTEQLTLEQLFERFPELKGATLNEQPSQVQDSSLVESGKGTFEDPTILTANKKLSRVTASACPDDPGATIIKISSSSLTRQTKHASKVSDPDGILKGDDQKDTPGALQLSKTNPNNEDVTIENNDTIVNQDKDSCLTDSTAVKGGVSGPIKNETLATSVRSGADSPPISKTDSPSSKKPSKLKLSSNNKCCSLM